MPQDPHTAEHGEPYEAPSVEDVELTGGLAETAPGTSSGSGPPLLQ